jgi:hypothetical protein
MDNAGSLLPLLLPRLLTPLPLRLPLCRQLAL